MATIETATYRLEFVAVRIVVDQIIALRTDLRYFSILIYKKSYLFGDNKNLITSSTIPYSSLIKRHNALAYHCVHEAIVSGFLKFIKIDGVKNPADILSKHCGMAKAWPLLQPLLFWSGDTVKIRTKKEVLTHQTKREYQDYD